MQTGDEHPAESVHRVTVRSDDEPRTNADYEPYPFTSEPRVISSTTALDSWQDAIHEIMDAQGVNETKAVNIAMEDANGRKLWEAAKGASVGSASIVRLL